MFIDDSVKEKLELVNVYKQASDYVIEKFKYGNLFSNIKFEEPE